MDEKLALIKDIEGCKTVEANWDGEGAIKPKNECIEEALIFLEEMPFEFPLPELQIFPGGTLGFYWDEETHGFYADIEILGDGRMAYFMVEGDRKEKGVTSLPGKKNGRDANTTPEKTSGNKKKYSKK